MNLLRRLGRPGPAWTYGQHFVITLLAGVALTMALLATSYVLRDNRVVPNHTVPTCGAGATNGPAWVGCGGAA
jgi:hypothetical protein